MELLEASDEALIREGREAGPVAIRRRKDRLDNAERVRRTAQNLPGRVSAQTSIYRTGW